VLDHVSSSRPTTMVAIPALNEAESVAAVVREVRACVETVVEVIVIDDGSSDGTAAEATAAGATVLTMPFTVGVGGAMRTAFVYAARNGLTHVVQVDADGQHDPRYIGEMLTKLSEHDIVIGARFAGVGNYQVKGLRRWAMWLLSWLISQIVGVRLSDATSGFRAVGPRAVAAFANEYPSEYLGDTVESLVLAHRAGLSISQVPVAMRFRQAGSPSQNRLMASTYLARAMLVIGLSLLRTSKQSGPTAPAPPPSRQGG
jgi:glycosyltransferase involved in cell wall biosynthesis